MGDVVYCLHPLAQRTLAGKRMPQTAAIVRRDAELCGPIGKWFVEAQKDGMISTIVRPVRGALDASVTKGNGSGGIVAPQFARHKKAPYSTKG